MFPRMHAAPAVCLITRSVMTTMDHIQGRRRLDVCHAFNELSGSSVWLSAQSLCVVCKSRLALKAADDSRGSTGTLTMQSL